MAKAVINLQKESGGIVKISPVDGIGVTEVTVPESGNLVSVGTAVTDNAIARYDGTTGKLQNSGVVIDDNGNVGVGIAPNCKLDLGGGYTLNGAKFLVYNDNNTSDLHGTKVGFYMDRFGSNNLDLVYPTDINTPGSLSIVSKNTFDNTTGSLIERVRVDAYGNLLLTSGTGALGYGAGAGGIVTQLTSKTTEVTLNKPSGNIITSASNLEPSQTIQFVVRNSLVQDRTTNIIVSIYNSVNSSRYDVSASNTGPGNFFVNLTNKSNVSLAEVLQIKFDLIQGAVS